MNFKDRIHLLRADIDRYVNNPDFSNVWFPKGRSGVSYFIKLIILFFIRRRNCFRLIFYYRIGRVSKLISWLFPVPFAGTVTISCPNVMGGGIYFAHPYSTVLNCEHIGFGCAFMHNTTLGNSPKNGKKICRPWLGDNVKVGANVVIIGDVRVGNNVKIGAGSVVTKSIPDNCTVVGNPARIVKKDGERVDIPL